MSNDQHGDICNVTQTANVCNERWFLFKLIDQRKYELVVQVYHRYSMYIHHYCVYV